MFRRRLVRSKGSPNVAEVEADVLGNSVILENLDSYSDAFRMLYADGCDELSCLPVDLVVLDGRVLHND